MTITLETAPAPAAEDPPLTSVAVDETYWGYVIRTDRRPRSARVLRRAALQLIALGAALAGVALWLMPEERIGVDPVVARIVAAAVLSFCALGLTRREKTEPAIELQVNLRLAEVRRIARHPGGEGELLARLSFAECGRPSVETTVDGTRLVLRRGGTALPVAEGPSPLIDTLRDRLGRDLARIRR
ncbi:hypothetical protein [Histidinibacterium aquaticum]|uniref:DUF2244 domain-containing protein n=1 Tax=Histidinibacterium aquaticum TaxID=2613962 RepID=A0A5J5GP83_9RHOB|nr:hypothetical protein [Histidinibacterium aquaticum]KAA9009252.1 hypothetical protein F3S47_08340 [Histidinibacterium aquaticum]